MAKGWSESRGSFVQSYGSEALDASALLMPLTFFVAPNDPRMLATVDAIRSPAARGGLAADGLVCWPGGGAAAGPANPAERPEDAAPLLLGALHVDRRSLTRAGAGRPLSARALLTRVAR